MSDNNRMYTQESDQDAANQLGLDPAQDYSIFMAAVYADIITDTDELNESLEEYGSSSDCLQEFIKEVRLPMGYMLVGMAPYGKKNPKTYGIINAEKLKVNVVPD